MKQRLKAWIDDTRGAFQVEYIIVMTLVALAMGVALAGLSLPLIWYHQTVKLFVVLPLP